MKNLFWAASIYFLFPLFSLSAQPPEAEPEVEIQAGGLQVIVDVVVTDRRNRLVTDLRAEDFAVYEDDVLQELDQAVLVSASGMFRAHPGGRPSAPGDDAQTPAPSFPLPPARTC